MHDGGPMVFPSTGAQPRDVPALNGVHREAKPGAPPTPLHQQLPGQSLTEQEAPCWCAPHLTLTLTHLEGWEEE
jgi:hypothetical protein